MLVVNDRDLEKSGFESLGDILYFFPRSYIDFGKYRDCWLTSEALGG